MIQVAMDHSKVNPAQRFSHTICPLKKLGFKPLTEGPTVEKVPKITIPRCYRLPFNKSEVLWQKAETFWT